MLLHAVKFRDSFSYEPVHTRPHIYTNTLLSLISSSRECRMDTGKATPAQCTEIQYNGPATTNIIFLKLGIEPEYLFGTN